MRRHPATAPGRNRRRGRVAAAVVAAAALVLAGSACEPTPPPVVFLATAGYGGTDANPGDGQCATTSGFCGLETAVMEANALHAASGAKVRVELLWSPDYGHSIGTSTASPVSVTGDVTIVSARPDRFTWIETTRIHVAAGARLEIDVDLINHYLCHTFTCPPRGDAKFAVDGTLILRNTRLHMGGVHIITVNPGGVAYLGGMDVTGTLYGGRNGEDGSQAIWNEGTVVLDHTTVGVGGTVGAVATFGAGRTIMAASTINLPPRDSLNPATWPAYPAGGPKACAGTPPASLGGNRAGATCQLTGPGDITTGTDT